MLHCSLTTITTIVYFDMCNLINSCSSLAQIRRAIWLFNVVAAILDFTKYQLTNFCTLSENVLYTFINSYKSKDKVCTTFPLNLRFPPD